MTPTDATAGQTGPVLGIILAAGRSTRMKTEWPKVMHEVCGRPMLAHVIDACRAAGIRSLCIVVGYRKQAIIDSFAADQDITWIDQTEQKGTGHAVQMCESVLRSHVGEVVIIAGDMPLVRSDTLRTLWQTHRQTSAVVTLATAMLDDPTGYGRIVRDGHGRLRGIVEHRDCTLAQLAIREVNPSYYCFNALDLASVLGKIRNDNDKGEYYITDTLALLIEAGHRAEAVTAVAAEDALGVNSRQELATINAVMRQRIISRWMDAGVTIVDPATTWIDARARIGGDTIIEPFCYIAGDASIGRNCRVGPFAYVAPGLQAADGTTIAPSNGDSRKYQVSQESGMVTAGAQRCQT